MKIEKEPLLPGEETFATFNIKSEMSAGDLAFWGPGSRMRCVGNIRYTR